MPIRMVRSYRDFIESKKREFGDKFDPSDLNPEFIPYFESGERIEVEFGYGERKRGFIGVSTGWKPIFLLIRTRRSIGSSYTIHDKDRVVGVIGKY